MLVPSTIAVAFLAIGGSSAWSSMSLLSIAERPIRPIPKRSISWMKGLRHDSRLVCLDVVFAVAVVG